MSISAAPAPALKTARIVSELTGRLVGGLVAERHETGEVTILFGGLRKRGWPLSFDDILEFERRGETP